MHGRTKTMMEQRYPIGIQSFKKIIEEGYAYVDKTGYIKTLLEQGHYIFLSRPRRFGKSLLLSTLESYFSGRRELFKGLAADRMDLDWTPSPVLRFDFNAEDYSADDGLDNILNRYLCEYEKEYDVTDVDNTIPGRFYKLLKRVEEIAGRKAVILVDEYDKPLLAVEHNRRLFERNQSLLKGFFGNLKTMDDHIRFAFITGVAKFAKVSIFSDLNNLDDISFSNAYSDICGLTEQELLDNFRPGIEVLSQEREEDFDSTLRALRDYYEGYLFSKKGKKLYNPYSVLKSLKSKEIQPY